MLNSTASMSTIPESTTSCGDVALSQSPALQKFLPPGYDYHVCSVAETQTEFDHPAVTATIRLALKTEEAAKEWFLKTRCTPVTWRVTTKRLCLGKKVVYKMEYNCQHNVRERSDTPNNRTTSKNTACPAKMTLTVKRAVCLRSKDLHLPQYPTVITLRNIHNHDVYSAATMKHRDVGQKAIGALTKLFESGHSAPSALAALHSDLQAEYGDNYVYVAADRATCPDLAFCHKLHKQLFTQGQTGAPLKHQAVVLKTFNCGSNNFVPLTPDRQKELLKLTGAETGSFLNPLRKQPLAPRSPSIRLVSAPEHPSEVRGEETDKEYSADSPSVVHGEEETPDTLDRQRIMKELHTVISALGNNPLVPNRVLVLALNQMKGHHAAASILGTPQRATEIRRSGQMIKLQPGSAARRQPACKRRLSLTPSKSTDHPYSVNKKRKVLAHHN